MPDAREFEAFYRDNLARVVRACTLVTLDRTLAEDVVAEAFARLWSRWGHIQGPDHAGGYVFKTAMRLCAREVERRRRRPPLASEGAGEEETTTTRHDVMVAMAGLPLRQRQAVVLRDWAGYSTAETASMIGTRESTVRVHLARARETLRRSLLVEERDER
jgi:RNA polymerase sigma factor (sigma-70 family)